MNTIKWKKLKRIASNLVGREVSLTLTTDSSMDGYFALAEFNESKVLIIINGNKCKSIDEIIESIAHEIAHVIINNNQHTNEHEKTWRIIQEEMKRKY